MVATPDFKSCHPTELFSYPRKELATNLQGKIEVSCQPEQTVTSPATAARLGVNGQFQQTCAISTRERHQF